MGYKVILRFKITQHTRDEQLLKNFINYFSCGRYKLRSGRLLGDFLVTQFSDVTEKVIPFFDKYPLIGEKAKDFECFKKVAQLMKEGAHLTPEGLEDIRNIKAGMNRGRKTD